MGREDRQPGPGVLEDLEGPGDPWGLQDREDRESPDIPWGLWDQEDREGQEGREDSRRGRHSSRYSNSPACRTEDRYSFCYSRSSYLYSSAFTP